jgi:hypothetical protein
MKTLVIHPKDETTDFLSTIYAGKDWTVITDNPSGKLLKAELKSHDRIIMLGHGTNFGLIGFGRYVIQPNLVYLLREKDCVCIWCNADQFVEKYKLSGFHTGMIVSEYEEAVMFAIRATNEEIEHSNTLFAKAIKESIDSTDILKCASEIYSDDTNPVILFNKKNLYHG